MAEIVQMFYDNVGENITVGDVEKTGSDDKKVYLEFSTDHMELDFDEIELLQGWLDWVKNDYLEAL